jgi:phage gpG-like protein
VPTVGFEALDIADSTAELLRSGGNLQSMTPVVGEILLEALERVFAEEGAVGGRSAWEPSKRALDVGGMTLQDTANLVGSLQSEHDETSAAAGSDVPYGIYHLPGGEDGDRKIPERDWLAIDVEATTDEVVDFVLNEVLSR